MAFFSLGQPPMHSVITEFDNQTLNRKSEAQAMTLDISTTFDRV